MKFDAFDEEFSLIEDILYKNTSPISTNSTASTDLDEKPGNFSKVSVNSDDFNASLNCTTSTRHNDVNMSTISQKSFDFSKSDVNLSAKNFGSKLDQIRHHPLFSALQKELLKECAPSTSSLPFSLLGAGMPQSSSQTSTTTVNEQVAQQDAALRQEFATITDVKDGKLDSLKELYTRESEKLENDRYQALCANIYYTSCKKSVNNYYDCERLVLIERVWKSLELFKKSLRHDSGMVDSIDTENESCSIISETADSSGVPVDNVLPNMTHKEDSIKTKVEIDDIDVKAGDFDLSWEKSDEIGALFSNSSSDCDNSSQSESESKSDKKRSSGDSGLARKTLNTDVTEIMQEWYNQNFDHPYPADETVKDLASKGGITVTQVKKWFANKRVRSFNTLSFNGSVHPARLRRERKQKVVTSPVTSPESQAQCQATTKVNVERNLDAHAVNVLNAWYYNHMNHPYPSQEEKIYLANMAGISVQQLNSWFNNKRNRTGNTRRLVPHYFTKFFDKNPAAAIEVLQRKRKLPQNALENDFAKQPCLVPTSMPFQTMQAFPSPPPVYMGYGTPMMQHPMGHF